MRESCFFQEVPFRKIQGFLIGHQQDDEAATGCSVVLFPKGATGGAEVRGGAPGTRETDLLRPENMMEVVHGVVLSGGSAYGLSAASGVMKFLEERDIGFETGSAKVPIVCGAVLYDLAVGSAKIRPDESMGYEACRKAFLGNFREMPPGAGEKEQGDFEIPGDEKQERFEGVKDDEQWREKFFEGEEQGNVGAGAGASVGKLLGMDFAMKGGLGIWAGQAGDLQVGAVVAVNAVGDVVDPKTGEILAGLLGPDKSSFLSTENAMLQRCVLFSKGGASPEESQERKGKEAIFLKEGENIDLETKRAQGVSLTGKNTTIGVVITNAKLTKAQANKVASMAQNGLARVLRPAHTMFDGDTLFVMASGEVEADISTVGMLGALAVEKAILRGIKAAKPQYGLKACLKK